MFHTAGEQCHVRSKFTIGIAFMIEVEVVADEDVVASIYQTELLLEVSLLEGNAGVFGAAECVVDVVGHDWELAGTCWIMSRFPSRWLLMCYLCLVPTPHRP